MLFRFCLFRNRLHGKRPAFRQMLTSLPSLVLHSQRRRSRSFGLIKE